jgi:hypothetical protein
LLKPGVLQSLRGKRSNDRILFEEFIEQVLAIRGKILDKGCHDLCIALPVSFDQLLYVIPTEEKEICEKIEEG